MNIFAFCVFALFVVLVIIDDVIVVAKLLL